MGVLTSDGLRPARQTSNQPVISPAEIPDFTALVTQSTVSQTPAALLAVETQQDSLTGCIEIPVIQPSRSATQITVIQSVTRSSSQQGPEFACSAPPHTHKMITHLSELKQQVQTDQG